ncbi:MAG: class I SAM-dependent methyltransferase [Proteobacteria bacterium]|nr:class I SAM-dependent methyltransferase [Pseudomonadota bacterium]
MQVFINKIKRKLLSRLVNESYETKIKNEILFYKDCHNVHDLPDIFHYWSNKYLLPLQKPFGFTNPDDFFVHYCKRHCIENSEVQKIKILSVGSGNGELEIKIASELSSKNLTNFSIECMDINQHMLARTTELAREKGVDRYLITNKNDFNKWVPKTKYNVVIANQSLHHVLELEHLFDSIYKGLRTEGLFLTSDMIGRNGHMRWPEALDAIEPFWDELPREYKYNQLLKKQYDKFYNHDCSTQGFEGIRAQDILNLLVNKFNFEFFLPFANIINPFIDRAYGHNFNTNNPVDTEFIDKVHAKDEELILSGIIKPTQMLAVMTKAYVNKTTLRHPALSPKHCIRK